MFSTLSSHCKRCCCRRDESTDGSRGNDSSFFSHHLWEDESNVFYARHHDDKEPDTIGIEKMNIEYWMYPYKPSLMKPIRYIEKGILCIWKEGEDHENNHGELEWVTQFFSRKSSLKFCEKLLRGENKQQKDSKDDSDAVVSIHGYHTDHIRDEGSILTRHPHTFTMERRIHIRSDDEKSWNNRSEKCPELVRRMVIEPDGDSSEKSNRGIRSYASESDSSSDLRSSPWEFSFGSDESTKRECKKKSKEGSWFHMKKKFSCKYKTSQLSLWYSSYSI